MVTKKIKTKQNKLTDSAPGVADIEAKRREFQQAVAGNNKISGKSQPKHHTPRRRTLIIFVGAFLVMVGSALVAYAYFFWYNSPDKIVADALTNAVSAQSVAYTAEINAPTKPIATLQGKYMTGLAEANTTIHTGLANDLNKVRASLVATPRDTYVKLSHATQLARQVAPLDQKKTYETFTPLVAGIVDDKWLRVTPADLTILQGVTHVSDCTANSIRSALVNPRTRTTIGQLYMSSPFFTIKEIKTEKQYSTYQLTIVKQTLDAFLDAVTTNGETPLSKCNLEIAAIKRSTMDATVTEVIIDRTTRTITQIIVNTSGKDPVTTMVVPVFGQPVTISEPQNATRFADIKAQFYTLLDATSRN